MGSCGMTSQSVLTVHWTLNQKPGDEGRKRNQKRRREHGEKERGGEGGGYLANKYR